MVLMADSLKIVVCSWVAFFYIHLLVLFISDCCSHVMERIHYCSGSQDSITQSVEWWLPCGAHFISHGSVWTRCEEELATYVTEHNGPAWICISKREVGEDATATLLDRVAGHLEDTRCMHFYLLLIFHQRVIACSPIFLLLGSLKFLTLTLALYAGWSTSWPWDYRESV